MGHQKYLSWWLTQASQCSVFTPEFNGYCEVSTFMQFSHVQYFHALQQSLGILGEGLWGLNPAAFHARLVAECGSSLNVVSLEN